MFRPRVIPVLLLKDKGLVKSRKFGRYRYIGDPINAVRIFNDHETDELVFLDISASAENRTIPVELVGKIGDEAFMPFAVGGGIRTVDDIWQLISAGAEKVVINTAAVQNPSLVREAAEQFGNQTIIVSIDVRRTLFGKQKVYISGGRKATSLDPVAHAVEMANAGAGEILLNTIDRDGEMCGYDVDLLRSVAEAVEVPVVACGGAGTLNDIAEVVKKGGASACAAGSMFVFHGPRRAVLINYPDRSELTRIFE